MKYINKYEFINVENFPNGRLYSLKNNEFRDYYQYIYIDNNKCALNSNKNVLLECIKGNKSFLMSNILYVELYYKKFLKDLYQIVPIDEKKFIEEKYKGALNYVW